MSSFSLQGDIGLDGPQGQQGARGVTVSSIYYNIVLMLRLVSFPHPLKVSQIPNISL